MAIYSSLGRLFGGRISRRFWLTQLGVLGLGTAACSSGPGIDRAGNENAEESGSELKLSFACVDNFDRTHPLVDGVVKPEGIQLEALATGPSELFRRVAQQTEFDITEMSTSTYMIQTSRGLSRLSGSREVRMNPMSRSAFTSRCPPIFI